MLKLQGYEASLSGFMAVSKHNRQKFALRFSKNTKLQNANVITKVNELRVQYWQSNHIDIYQNLVKKIFNIFFDLGN